MSRTLSPASFRRTLGGRGGGAAGPPSASDTEQLLHEVLDFIEPRVRGVSTAHASTGGNPACPPLSGLRAECARRDAAARAATEALDCLRAVLALPHAALRAPVPALSPSLSLSPIPQAHTLNFKRPDTLYPTPYTLNLKGPYTLHPTPYTLDPTPYTLHPTPYTLHPILDSRP